MASIASFVVLVVILCCKEMTCSEEVLESDAECSTSYKSLVKVLMNDDRNSYNLQRTFFPPISTSPVFVAVTYMYNNSNNVTSVTKTFFWSSAVYFFFHPVRIFQFTSLLFSDPSLRYNEITLFLPEDCYAASDNFMLLLTQRLKLYTMHQKPLAPIDDSYVAYSHSVDTLNSWYTQNLAVGNLAVISQVLFPIFVTFYIVIFFIFVLELKPHNFGKKLENELTNDLSSVKADAEAKLLTKVTISILFHFCCLAADIAALVQYKTLPEKIHSYYFSTPKRFWSVPIIMLLFDVIAFFCFIVAPFGLYKYHNKRYKLIYCLIGPLSCIASHSYHIIFAFIHDPYHATSILLLYAIIVFVHIQGFEKLFYYIHGQKLWDKHITICDNCCGHICSCCYDNILCVCVNYILLCCSHLIKKCLCCCKCLISCLCSRILTCCQWSFKRIGLYNTAIAVYMIEFMFMAGSVGLSLALLILLPISNAIDDAPSRLYVIYQASVTFFAALIAFQLLFKHSTSIFGVFIKAINTQAAKSKLENCKLKDVCKADLSKVWAEMSDQEKEYYLAKWVMSAMIPQIQVPNAANNLPTPQAQYPQAYELKINAKSLKVVEQFSRNKNSRCKSCCCKCRKKHEGYENLELST